MKRRLSLTILSALTILVVLHLAVSFYIQGERAIVAGPDACLGIGGKAQFNCEQRLLRIAELEQNRWLYLLSGALVAGGVSLGVQLERQRTTGGRQQPRPGETSA